MQNWRFPSRNSTGFLVAVLAVPTIVIVGLGVGLVVWLLSASADRLDATQLEGEARLARNVIQSNEKGLSKFVADYSNWNEMYDYFNGPSNAEWERENLGPYVLDAHGSDHFIVVSKDGRLVNHYSRASGSRNTLKPADAQMLARLTTLAFAKETLGKGFAVSGIVEYDGAPYIAAASTIHVSEKERVERDRAKFSMIQMRALDATMMAQLAHDYGLSDAHIARNAKTGVSLRTPWGNASPFSFVWTPSNAGQAYSTTVTPYVFAMGVAMLLLFSGLAFVWSRIIAQIGASEARAQRANAAKSEFLAMISHEVRTPLNGVLGMTAALLETELKPEQQHYASVIRDSGESLLRIINDVLDFSKLDAGKMEIENAAFDLPFVLHYAAEICEPRAKEKGLALNVEIDPKLPQFVKADAGRLRQVALNLLTNAVKFTQTGRVELRTFCVARTDERVTLRVEVSDTGIGIPPDRLGKLFQSFTQADVSISRRFGGTGLGLAICKKLIERMGGTIGVESHVGKGSTFWFELPVVPASAAEVSNKATVSDEQADDAVRTIKELGRPLRLLLAEDNATNQLVAKAALAKYDIVPDLAGNGLEAVEAVRRKDYDIVLMDMQMPELDGIAATRIIRQMPGRARAVPIVALTANAFESDIIACHAAGMNGHLGKPFRRDELIVAIGHALKGDDRPVAVRPPAANNTAAQAIDIGVLEAFRADNGESMLRLLVDGYLETAAEQLDRLQALLLAGEAGAPVVLIAHSLKSSSAMAGAMALAAMSARLETQLRHKTAHPSLDDAAQMRSLFAAYRTGLEANGFLAAA